MRERDVQAPQFKLPNGPILQLVESTLLTIISLSSLAAFSGWAPHSMAWLARVVPYVWGASLIYALLKVGVPYARYLAELHRQGR
jgi:hypothetical protein